MMMEVKMVIMVVAHDGSSNGVSDGDRQFK